MNYQGGQGDREVNAAWPDRIISEEPRQTMQHPLSWPWKSRSPLRTRHWKIVGEVNPPELLHRRCCEASLLLLAVQEGTLDYYLKGIKEGYLAQMTVPTAPETPSSHVQPDVVLREESDDSLAMGKEEDGDCDIVPNIGSQFPTPRDNPLFPFSKVST